MGTIRDLLDKAKFVREGIPGEVSAIIDRNKDKILDINREMQLFEKGINSDGEMLKPYAPKTIKIKRSKGEVYNRRTLLDTGDFYRGFDLMNRNNTITIFSRDSKSSELQDDNGSNIFGITKENQPYYNYEIIKPELQEFINKHIG